MAFVKFGNYIPDLARLYANGLTRADNLVLRGTAYNPIPTPSAIISLPGPAKAGMWFDSTSGDTYGIIVTAGGIYRVSRTAAVPLLDGLNYDTASMVQYGDIAIVVSPSSDTLYFTLGSSTPPQPLPGAPRGRMVAVVREFVFIGDTVDEDGPRLQRVRWCGINNPMSWTPDPATLADFQDIAGPGGRVTGIVGGEYGVIFQERSIWRATFVGAPLSFQFDEVERGRGCLATGSLIDVGNMPDGGRGIFYIAEDGFYRFTGQTSIPISQNMCSLEMINDLDKTRLDEVVTGWDATGHTVWWSIPSLSEGRVSYIYNYTENGWTRAPSVKATWFGSTSQPVVSLDDLPSLGYTNLDTMDVSLDDPIFSGGVKNFSLVDEVGNLATFTGSPMDAIVVTSENLLTDEMATWLSQVRPVLEGGGWGLSIGHRLNQTDPVVWTPEVNPDYDGAAKVRVHTRFIQARVRFYGDWSEAQGLIFNVKRRGRR